MSEKIRSLVRKASVAYAGSDGPKRHNRYDFATIQAAATVLAAGFFNDWRRTLQAGDVIDVTAGLPSSVDLFRVIVLTAPSTGDVTVKTDDSDEIEVSARAVVPTDDGLTTGLLLATDSFVAVTSANAAHWLTLPAIASVPLGKKIEGLMGGTACELRTPATSNTTINNTDGDSLESVLAANCYFMAIKTSATNWTLLTIAPGAVAAPVPD